MNLNLETGLFRPYMKPNSNPTYVHKDSNHPKGILENIPHSVNRRLSSISSNKEVFESAIPPFQEALKKSGYDYTLNFEPPSKNMKAKNRSRNITYFNPPFSLNVQTNIGKQFLKLLDKHFPTSHPLRKVINRNTVKVSYRCMGNMKQKISRHNSKIQQAEEVRPSDFGCNCTAAIGPCPLAGNCLVNSVVYGAEVISNNSNKQTYTGLTRNTFKKRFYGHRSSFTNKEQEHSTTLSTYVWQLQDNNVNFDINWKIIGRAKPFNPVTKKCNLCIKEKYHIIFQPESASLNQRSELFSTCRHRLRDLLANIE